ncbi:hypothetical protein L7F22_068587 [Adiantum nelumboides]|nr:hypothetical protein [Adiantum nelumboides]
MICRQTLMQVDLPYGLPMGARKIRVAVFSGLDCVKLQCEPSEHTSASPMVMRFAIELVCKPYDLSASSNANRITKRLADGCSEETAKGKAQGARDAAKGKTSEARVLEQAKAKASDVIEATQPAGEGIGGKISEAGILEPRSLQEKPLGATTYVHDSVVATKDQAMGALGRLSNCEGQLQRHRKALGADAAHFSKKWNCGTLKAFYWSVRQKALCVLEAILLQKDALLLQEIQADEGDFHGFVQESLQSAETTLRREAQEALEMILALKEEKLGGKTVNCSSKDAFCDKPFITMEAKNQVHKSAIKSQSEVSDLLSFQMEDLLCGQAAVSSLDSANDDPFDGMSIYGLNDKAATHVKDFLSYGWASAHAEMHSESSTLEIILAVKEEKLGGKTVNCSSKDAFCDKPFITMEAKNQVHKSAVKSQSEVSDLLSFPMEDLLCGQAAVSSLDSANDGPSDGMSIYGLNDKAATHVKDFLSYGWASAHSERHSESSVS